MESSWAIGPATAVAAIAAAAPNVSQTTGVPEKTSVSTLGARREHGYIGREE